MIFTTDSEKKCVGFNVYKQWRDKVGVDFDSSGCLMDCMVHVCSGEW